jgi:predicted amidophosphoribosyltransferase
VRCVFRSDSGSLTLDVPPSPTSRWRAIVRVLRSPMDAFSCTASPASCSLCGSPLPQLLSVPICAVCWSEDPRFRGKACLHSGYSLDQTAQFDRPMTRGRAAGLASPASVRAYAAGHYRDRKKDAIHAFKCGRLYPCAGRLGGGLARAMTEQADEARAQMSVAPVLLRQQKHEQHWFTLTRMLAESMLPVLEKPRPQWRMTLVSKALLGQRRTESQVGLTSSKRRLNMRRAFAFSDLEAVRGKQILPFDDILTTGATARAVARILLQSGAASVWVATLAWARRQLNELRDNAQNKGRSSHWGPSGDGPDADGLEQRIESTIESSDRSSQHQPSF